MSTTVKRTSKSGRQSLFFHDLATPISSHRGKFTTPGQAAAVSALWRENFRGTDPPPPPIFTLEDHGEFSPESGIADYPMSPETKLGTRTPVRDSHHDSPSPLKGKSEASTSYAVMGGQQMQQSPARSSWWSPVKGGSEHDKKGKGSPVEGVVHSSALIMLPPPREVARPELQKNNESVNDLDQEEWVTVYGFSPGDTNLVLREFEKCGMILKHVPGPRDANWIHILYQNRSDARKSLSKDGMQINGALIVGVKPLDPIQCKVLNERINNQGFMTFPPLPASSSELIPSRASPNPNYVQNNSNSTQHLVGAIASPSKSIASKIMDMMFGI